MKALAIVVALLVGLPAAAQDVPLASPVTLAPCLSAEQETLLAQRLKRLEAENTSLKDSAGGTPTYVVVLVAVGAVLVGGAVGYGIGRAVAR